MDGCYKVRLKIDDYGAVNLNLDNAVIVLFIR
jgi:hypothetical protein